MTHPVTHVSPEAPAIVWGFGAEKLPDDARASAERMVREHLAFDEQLADTTDVRIHRSSSPINMLSAEAHGLERFVVSYKANNRTISPDETGTMVLLVWHGGHWELHSLTKQLRTSGVATRKQA